MDFANQPNQSRRRIPVVGNCCFMVPLKIGALIIATWMLVWYMYAGLALVLVPYGGSFLWVGLKVLGVVYALAGLVSLYGIYAIYKVRIPIIPSTIDFILTDAQHSNLCVPCSTQKQHQELPFHVARFTKLFTIAAIYYLVVQVIVIIIEEVELRAIYNNAVNQCEAAQANVTTPHIDCNIGFVDSFLVSWIISYIIGLAFQIYFIIVIRSYNADLQARTNNGEKGAVDMNTYGLQHA
ncbi:hypothetical protein BC936DRAFT_140017 [Jimgerdemannia flammicorona]|uniref:Uncharacterized protein n=1 Tax=Jimgerdemannia flammicorona TaxID=994334 RepID=A0A433DH76_9FUNG|nr:hypothetical protein BC936DRAFT_140017 [Jimgerdemannia flammicorona]